MTEDAHSDADTELLQRIGEHSSEIAKSLNPQTLIPLLVEDGSLNDEERRAIVVASRQIQSKMLLECFKRTPTRFLQCLEEEKDHCGHEYIVDLVKGNVFAIDSQIEKSKQYRERVKQNREEIIRDLDITYLIQVMLEEHLLTWSESQELEAQATYEGKSTFLLDEVLDTKGPVAYLKLAECLEQEQSVPRHADIFELITGQKPRLKPILRPQRNESSEEELESDNESIVGSMRKRPAVICPLEEPLTGDAYEALMSKLWRSCHEAQWEALEREVNRLTNDSSSTDPQLKVVALLELAKSYVFRHNWANVDKCIQDAESLKCTALDSDKTNTAYLKCRIELVLSLRNLLCGDLKSSIEHLYLAKEALFDGDIIRSCDEEYAWLSYCSGCLQLERKLSEIHDQESPHMHFQYAINCACSYSKDTIQQQSYIRQAECYLGCSLLTVNTTKDQESIKKAEALLKNVEKCANSLTRHSKSLYFIALSDLHRTTGAIEEARKCAQTAVNLSCVGFMTELQAAEKRLELLPT